MTSDDKAKPNPVPSRLGKVATSSYSNMLTPSEIEELRQHAKESMAYALKAFTEPAKKR